MTQTRAFNPAPRLLVAILVCLAVMTALMNPVSAGSDDGRRSIAVKLRPGVDPQVLAGRYNLTVATPLLASRGLYILEPASRGRTAKSDKLKDVAKDLAKRSDVVWAEVEESGEEIDDSRFHAWPEGLPAGRGDDPAQWLDQPNLRFLELDAVHRRVTGTRITVAVLDTGADMDHPHLVDHLSRTGHYDYIDDDNDPGEEINGRDDDGDGRVDESYGHGTHTAGLVALVAPDTDLLVYRVLDSDGSGNPYLVAEAIDDAVAAGVDVINLSFGMGGKPKSKVLIKAFDNAEKHNIAVVAAVGNDGDKGDRYPSNEKNVIGVAAMADGNSGLTGFSNYGKPAMVAAPGEDIVSTLPGGGFGAWSGTSMAAPIVAGQVALIRSKFPDMKVKKVIQIVGKTSSRFKGKRTVEKGLIDIRRSLLDS